VTKKLVVLRTSLTNSRTNPTVFTATHYVALVCLGDRPLLLVFTDVMKETTPTNPKGKEGEMLLSPVIGCDVIILKQLDIF
jgi:hypothetical protein